MNKFKAKHPSNKKNPSTEKRPFANLPSGRFDTHFVSWKLSCMDKDGSWGWNKVTGKAFWEVIHDKLSSFESMTWAEIKKNDNSHTVATEKITREARDRLIDIKQNDIDELFSLRLRGKERIWGIREGYALKILWWDPDHQVCPSHKKHT